MAWISVHEQVIGGKLRNLAKEIGCSQNEALGILIRLWLWAINNAGKDGCIVGADKDDVAEVLNMGIDRRYSADDVVDALVVTGWVDMENGLYIHDWEEWQEQWYKAIEVREKDAARKRKERSLKRMMKNQSESAVVTPLRLPGKIWRRFYRNRNLIFPMMKHQNSNQPPPIPTILKKCGRFIREKSEKAMLTRSIKQD